MTRHLPPMLSISQCVSHKSYHSVICSLTFFSSSIESPNEDGPFWKSLVRRQPNRDKKNCWRNSKHDFITMRLNKYSICIHCSSSNAGRSCKTAQKLQIYSQKDLALVNHLAISVVFLMCLDLVIPTKHNLQYLCNQLTTLHDHGLRSLISSWPQQIRLQRARPWLNGGL